MCTEPGCGRSFNRPAKLKQHVLTAHKDVKPFKCEEKGKCNVIINAYGREK